jgi:hypothetical protein
MKKCRKGLHLHDPGSKRCPECRRASNIRYDQSEKRQAVRARYEKTRIRVRIAGVVDESYRVPPEKKAELQERLATFRADQRSAYRQEAL